MVVLVGLLIGTPDFQAGTWHGIEPLKSRRADVVRELGQPLQDETASGVLNFKVAGGMISVSFVSAKFVETKKLSPDTEGTVLLMVLQHENSSDTPESLALVNNSSYQREQKDNLTVFYNQKEGISYTFFNGRLKTTRYAAAADQMLRAQRPSK